MGEQETFEINKTIRKFLDVVKIFVLAYFTYLTIAHLADKDKIQLSFFLDALLNISGQVYISWSITAASLLLALRFYLLMKKKIKQLSPSKDTMERKYWSNKRVQVLSVMELRIKRRIDYGNCYISWLNQYFIVLYFMVLGI